MRCISLEHFVRVSQAGRRDVCPCPCPCRQGARVLVGERGDPDIGPQAASVLSSTIAIAQCRRHRPRASPSPRTLNCLGAAAGSGKSRVKTSTRFRLERKYEPIKVLGSGAYGVVTLPFSVREGINIFLAGAGRRCPLPPPLHGNPI